VSFNRIYGSCVWALDDEGTYHTSCGEVFWLEDGTPEENGCRFCHHCGARLVVVELEEDEEE